MVVYLDHAATTPLRPEAREAWLEASANVGNPSSIHTAGQSARRSLEEARERLAAALDCDAVEVVFTSGGTESINLALKGLFWARRGVDASRNAIVVPAGEHHATIDAVEWLEKHEGAQLRWPELDGLGRLSLSSWTAALGDDVAFATLLAANNEVGTLQPIIDAAAASARAGVPMHLDAVGAFGHVDVSFRRIRAEQQAGTQDAGGAGGLAALSVSAHKIGGPAGIGALVVSREAIVTPLVHGGGQQRGLRSGTQDVASAVAFGVAAELAVDERDVEALRLATLRDDLVGRVLAAVPGASLNGDSARRLPGNAHFSFPGAQGDSLLLMLDLAGVAASTGSACQAGVPDPSHVLLAMGRDDDAARSVLRVTLGRESVAADVDAFVAAIPQAYDRARRAGMARREV